MSKTHMVDVAGAVAFAALIAALAVVPSVNTGLVLYVGLGSLALYAFVVFEAIPMLKARRIRAEEFAVASRKVLRLPLPSEMETRRGEYKQDRRRTASLARVAGQ